MNVQTKRANLKERMVDAASRQIAEKGLSGFRARDVAAEVRCALGGIYNVFDDLDTLILHVNANTLDQLQEAFSTATSVADPTSRLKALARIYADFARGNQRRWDALFDHRLAGGKGPPDWLAARYALLLDHVIKPLKTLFPDWNDAVLHRRSRTMFGAAHGLVTISLQKRFFGLDEVQLRQELDMLVDALVAEPAAR